jgi:hypothetical protein
VRPEVLQRHVGAEDPRRHVEQIGQEGAIEALLQLGAVVDTADLISV